MASPLSVSQLLDGGKRYFDDNPESGLGRTLSVTRTVLEAGRGQPLVLVFGDSRMGEGFSPNLATTEAKQLGEPYVFANSAVPGTTPRVWYYLLRHYRDAGLRPTAIVLMTTTFRDESEGADPNRISDVSFVHPWLGVRDLLDFPFTFSVQDDRQEAAESILLRGRSFQNDLQDFILHPQKRIDSVVVWREHGSEMLAGYPGRDSSLADLHLDLNDGALSSSTGKTDFPAPLVAYAQRLSQTHGAPPEDEQAREYWALWYGAIAQLSEEMGAKLLILRIARGPFHSLVGPGPEPDGVLAELASAGKIALIPQTAFAPLERPEFFFDQLHMNRKGRETFSPMLANEVLRVLVTP